ncbi:MAG: hypothetical protein M1815_005629 [Lichina confinis]|nr:MAG: hypothetical protein M1815_005629 [Lichina confinis]
MSEYHEPLPFHGGFANAEEYVESLLCFTTSSDLFQHLCGGVHILDFFTREPDLYAALLPESWREWFHKSSIEDTLDLLMRQDLDVASSQPGPPPSDLLDYIKAIRKHSLRRDWRPPASCSGRTTGSLSAPRLAHNVATGMNQKKRHEVFKFSNYVDRLATENAITHLVDFGSGQSYLGRALAREPYNRRVIAVEGKQSNIDGAQLIDHRAKVGKRVDCFGAGTVSQPQQSSSKPLAKGEGDSASDLKQSDSISGRPAPEQDFPNILSMGRTRGALFYVQHRIEDGDLSFLRNAAARANREPTRIPDATEMDGGDEMQERASMEERAAATARADEAKGGGLKATSTDPQSNHGEKPGQCLGLLMPPKPRLMVISLHSCGNLIHHGLRSLILNDFVVAVAMVGCCYNLMTERLGPPTYKLPSLRPRNARVMREGLAYDPQGFPMSQRLSFHTHMRGQGVRFNITARMMAVQAPQNWTSTDSSGFFTRHFFRALLQRIFLDRGVVQETRREREESVSGDEQGKGSAEATDPVIIGSLRAACYTSFRSYVRGAVAKLARDPECGPQIQHLMGSLTDEQIDGYERRYQGRKKDLSVVWSLMAFSAGLVEACIVVDRWSFLKEQKEVKRCWVEPIFDYSQSPRNLVVVGIKR